MTVKTFLFSVPGVVGKARPRLSRFGNVYTPKKTSDYEDMVRILARSAINEQCGGSWDLHGAVEICITAAHEIPKSWTKKKKALALSQLIKPGKPDLDNVEKIILDGLNNIAYADDSQVFSIKARKCYSIKCDRETGRDVPGEPYVFVSVTATV